MTEGKRDRKSHIWDRDPNDWYVESSWVSARLFEEEPFEGGIYDPACGTYRIVHSALEAGYDAVGSDLIDRGFRMDFQMDFIKGNLPAHVMSDKRINIVNNPPFKHCSRGQDFIFIRKALSVATGKVALILPTTWANSASAGQFLEETNLYREYRIGPRPSMPPGAVIKAKVKAGNGTKDYSWFIWLKGFDGDATVRWLRRDA